ncbi:uncharacterized protein LOC9632861 [Selaginella moellendorffii]|nr:uncharacterized protein LOC9632861 [Selaginella moellendorffii]|eukprot:XP_002967635.2 uncharacterized protein LOC9632861 [Selaginella moellendorffii]
MEGIAPGADAMMNEMSSSDIAKRFELLESQWLDFQQRSSTPDLEEEPIEFPSSLASFDASNNVSSAPSECPKDSLAGRQSNIVLPRLKPFPPRALSKSPAFGEPNRADEDNINISQPDSPLSSSSSLSTSSSSSGSSSGGFGHSDPLSSRRKRLFSQPATPIKEAILDASSPKKTSAYKSSQAYFTTNRKDGDTDTPVVCMDTHQSRSPPPGFVAEDIDSTFKTSSKQNHQQQQRLSSRSLSTKNPSAPHRTAAKSTAVVVSKMCECVIESHFCNPQENDDCEGKTVLQSMHASLLQVLLQLESKEKSLGKAWKEWNDSPESSKGLKHFSELELLTSSKQKGFSGLPRVAGASSPEKWCDTVSARSQRLVSCLEKESPGGKWAISLEKESMRVYIVSEGRNQEGDKVLIKKIDSELYNYNHMVREVELMKECKHENIMRVLDIGQEEDGDYMVLEHLCDARDLQYERFYYKLSDVGLIKETIRQLLVGLASLHEREVVHQDIVPACIRFELNHSNFVVKLGDFHCSRRLSTPPNVDTMGGSMGFTAPEVISRETEKIGKGVDMWGVGAVLANMLLGENPFLEGIDLSLSCDANKAKVMDNMKKFLKRDWYEMIEDEDAVDLLRCLLVWDPDKRITAEQALKSMYFKVRPQDIEKKRVVVPVVKEEKEEEKVVPKSIDYFKEEREELMMVGLFIMFAIAVIIYFSLYTT